MDGINFRQAQGSFLIANTPIFLLRKLQADAAVQRLAASMTGEQLLAGLRTVSATEPQTLEQAVLPYIFLVALSFRMDEPALLRRATLVTPHSAHRWFDYIRTILIQTRQ